MCEPLYIRWTDCNNLGIPILDEQHRSIVSTLNTLHHFIRLGKSESIIDAILNTLDQHTSIHFTTEEQLLLKSGYPDLNKHISSHRRLLQKTNQIICSPDGRLQEGEILRFFKDWWLDHIHTEDREYVPYLLEASEQQDPLAVIAGKWSCPTW